MDVLNCFELHTIDGNRLNCGVFLGALYRLSWSVPFQVLVGNTPYYYLPVLGMVCTRVLEYTDRAVLKPTALLATCGVVPPSLLFD